jgi:IPT/TIG domain-containing protein
MRSKLHQHLSCAMELRSRRVWTASLVAVLLGAALAWSPTASAVTVTVGRQALSTEPTTNFGCSTTMPYTPCNQTVLPTALTAGARAVVPGDGAITSWRVVGSVSGVFHDVLLRVLRPSGGQYLLAGHSHNPTSLDGTPTTLSPAMPVEAGDRLGVTTGAQGLSGPNTDASAEVEAVGGMIGAAYSVFSGTTSDGQVVSPIPGQNVEPLFNADVVLDRPVLSSVSPASGSSEGGQTVTIDGDHLAGASQVIFGSRAAESVTAVSNTKVRAVTPASLTGTVHVTVETLGGTSATSAADRFTFTAGGGGGSGSVPPDRASFAGSRSSITVNRKRRFKFVFHGAAGLRGRAVFKSLRAVRTSSTRRVTLGQKSFTVPADGKVTLKMRLTKRKFRILRLNHKIRVRVTVTLENAAGLTSTASKRITLKAPPPQR